MKKWTPCLKIKGVKIDSTMWQYIKFRYVLYYRQVSNFQWASYTVFCKLSKIPFLIWSVTSREKRASDRHRNFRILFLSTWRILMLRAEVLIIVWCYWHYWTALIWSHKKFLSDTQIARFSASSSQVSSPFSKLKWLPWWQTSPGVTNSHG